jgi:hypothetical protein
VVEGNSSSEIFSIFYSALAMEPEPLLKVDTDFEQHVPAHKVHEHDEIGVVNESKSELRNRGIE